jgi:high-affinity Fe2+/Pb2+ permease
LEEEMKDLNKWLGYFSISVVMIMGILLVSGLVGYLTLPLKLLIGGMVFLYVIFRISLMRKRSRRNARQGLFSVENVAKKAESKHPNNT